MNHALQMVRKGFTWSVVVLTILWSVGATAFMPLAANAQSSSCPTLQSGDLFKVPGNPAVYLLNANMQRLYFHHSSAFVTWYMNSAGQPDYSAVVEMPTSCVDAYPAPSMPPYGVNFRPGSKLVKVQISPSVYVVEPGNKISKITSEAVAAALYGSNWASQVADVADAFWPNYANRGSDITEAKPHDGMLVKSSGSATVYYVKNGSKYTVDGTVRSSEVRTVSDAVLASVPSGTGTVTAASVYADPAQGVGGGALPPAAAGTLSISLASDTPGAPGMPAPFALANAARVPFTKVNFTAGSSPVTITSFKVVRGGAPAVNADFSTVNVVGPNGSLLNDSGKTLNSDNQATFTEDIVVPANSTVTYTLVGDMAAAAAMTNSNHPTLGIFSIETSATVVGSLPMYGNAVETNENVTLGSVTLAEGTVLSSVTKRVGDTNADLASVKITVATEDFRVERVVLYNSGSAADADLANIKLKYNNNVIANGTLANKYITFDLNAAGCIDACKIDKGNDKTFSVTGDIVGGSGRTIILDVQRAVHVLAKDLANSVYVTPTNNASAMDNTINISQGTLNVTKTNDVAAGNVPENATGIALATFNFKVMGEPIDIRTLVFRVTTTGTVVPTGIDNVALYNAAGVALTGGVDATGGTSGIPGYATSTDSFTLQPGDNLLTVKANIDSTPANNDAVRVDIDMSVSAQFDARGANTNETITLGTYATPAAFVTGNLMTIQTSALRVTQLGTVATTTYAAGVNDVVLEEVELDAAGSSEDLRVTQFKIADYTDNGGKTIDIQNIRLFVDKDGDSNNGAGTQVALTEVKNGSDSDANDDETFTFNLSGADQFVIKATKRVRVTVKGNITGGASTGNHVWRTNAANDVSAVGVNTGSTVSETVDATAGASKVTIGSAGGTVEVTIDSSSPDARLFAAGTQGVTLATFNFYATTTEDVELDYIYFTQRVTDTVSSSFQDYSSLYLVNEAGVTVASMTPTSTKPLLDFADNAFIVRTSDTDGAKLHLKANLSSIGPSQLITVGGHQIGFNISAAGDVVAKGDLTGSASVEYFGTNSPSGLTHYMYRGTPTYESLPLSSNTLSNGTVDIFKFKVTANTADIGLYKFTFDITTTSVTLTALDLYDVTESNEILLYSNSASTGFASPSTVDVLLDDDNPTGLNGGEERTVAVGTPRTYVLRGTFTGASSGDSVSTRLAGDSAAIGNAHQIVTTMASSSLVDSEVHDDFIWSDRHASGHSTSTADWTNGYLVNGLSSASGTSRVLSL